MRSYGRILHTICRATNRQGLGLTLATCTSPNQPNLKAHAIPSLSSSHDTVVFLFWYCAIFRGTISVCSGASGHSCPSSQQQRLTSSRSSYDQACSCRHPNRLIFSTLGCSRIFPALFSLAVAEPIVAVADSPIRICVCMRVCACYASDFNGSIISTVMLRRSRCSVLVREGQCA